MTLVVMRDHFEPLLNEWQEYLSYLTLHLFASELEITEDLTIDDFDEADFSGYEPVLLDDWKPAFLNAENKGEKDHEYVLFTYGPPGVNCQVYGYYIVDVYGYVFAAEADPRGPVYMNTPGQTYPVRPRITLGNQAPVPMAQRRKAQ